MSNDSSSAAVRGSGFSAGLGAVLTYTCQGRSGIYGATMGANGAGEWCVLFMGTPVDAENAAAEYLRRLERGGYRISAHSIVTNEPRFTGNSIRSVQAPLPGGFSA